MRFVLPLSDWKYILFVMHADISDENHPSVHPIKRPQFSFKATAPGSAGGAQANGYAARSASTATVSVSRVENSLRVLYNTAGDGFRVHGKAAVFLAAVLDHICRYICGYASLAAVNRGAKTVQPLDVYQVILEGADTLPLFRWTFAQASRPCANLPYIG